jgi:hypothetical protein
MQPNYYKNEVKIQVLNTKPTKTKPTKAVAKNVNKQEEKKPKKAKNLKKPKKEKNLKKPKKSKKRKLLNVREKKIIYRSALVTLKNTGFPMREQL